MATPPAKALWWTWKSPVTSYVWLWTVRPSYAQKTKIAGRQMKGMCHPSIGKLSHDLAKRGGGSQHYTPGNPREMEVAARSASLAVHGCLEDHAKKPTMLKRITSIGGGAQMSSMPVEASPPVSPNHATKSAAAFGKAFLPEVRTMQ